MRELKGIVHVENNMEWLNEWNGELSWYISSTFIISINELKTDVCNVDSDMIYKTQKTEATQVSTSKINT